MTLPVYIDITREEYEQFIKDQLKLQALEACGVEYWEGYDDAMDIYNENLSNS